MTRNATSGRLRGFFAAVLTASGLTLGGCAMPNASNPTLNITSTQISDRAATVNLAIDNASDYDLTLQSIDWTLVHGPLSVASGNWKINEHLASGSQVALSLRIPFESPSLDPTSREIELSGRLNFGDGAGDGAGNARGIESAAFDASGTSGR